MRFAFSNFYKTLPVVWGQGDDWGSTFIWGWLNTGPHLPRTKLRELQDLIAEDAIVKIVHAWCRARVRKSRYWGEMLQVPHPLLWHNEASLLVQWRTMYFALYCKLLFVYTVCCRRSGQCFSVLRTHKSDVVDGSSGRRYITDQWHNVPLLHARGIESHSARGDPAYTEHVGSRLKGKGKDISITGHESPWGMWMQGSMYSQPWY